MAGPPRTSRRSSTDDTSPLPTHADKRLLILTDVQQHPIHEVPGQLFGMRQITCKQMNSRAASRVASGVSRPSTAPGPNRRSVCCEVRDARNGGAIYHPPCWQDGTERPIHRPTDAAEPQEYDVARRRVTRAQTS